MRLALLVAAIVVTAGCITDVDDTDQGEDTRTASHVWRVTIQPEDPSAYEVEVPFLVPRSDDPRIKAPLEALRENTSAKAGTGLQWTGADQGRLVIIGQGPVTVEAARSFTPSKGDHEAFLDWRIPDDTVDSRQGGALEVVWAADFSGGTGHTCWASATWTVKVPEEGTASLGATDRVPAECA